MITSLLTPGPGKRQVADAGHRGDESLDGRRLRREGGGGGEAQANMFLHVVPV